MEHLSVLAHDVRRFLLTEGVNLSTGHAQQLLAAALGHNNLASYQASGEEGHLRFAIDIVVDEAKLQERANELDCPSGNHAVLAIRRALALRYPLATPHASLSDFLDRVQVYIEDRFTDDARAQVASAWLPWAQTPLPWKSIDPVGTSDLRGELKGLRVSEDDEDRRYSDHEVNVSSSIVVRRLGRRLFGATTVEVTRAQLRRDSVKS
jgi:hypothetical protein